jgi:hypothetical protein
MREMGWIAFASGLLIASLSAPAAPNLYVISENTGVVREFTTGGVQVGSSFTVPSAGETERRDLVVDDLGQLHVYNGTFGPSLSTRSTPAGTWTHHPFAGWDTINNVSYGGIGWWANWLFASDMVISGDASGVVRLDRTTGAGQRFDDGHDSIDVNVGLDGKVYSLSGDARVFDPQSLALLSVVSLAAAEDCRAIAADGFGRIYTASWDGMLRRFSAAGVLEASLHSGTSNLTDIDIAPDGTVIVGGRFGTFAVTTTSLASAQQFVVDQINRPVFVSFTTAIPEPATALIWALLPLAAARRVRSRA